MKQCPGSYAGGMSRSFTSTVMNPQTKNPKVLVPIRVRPTKKGYVKIHTNVGDMNIELYCNIVPRTCENFLGLCEMGYYNGVAFHRRWASIISTNRNAAKYICLLFLT